MKIHELELKAKKDKKRLGRGIGSGQGKTAGRGTKGQKARAGFSQRPGFEGGQTPLAQRFPKLRGFTSHRTPPQVVYTGALDALGATINAETLAAAGLITNPFVRVKLIVKGETTKKHAVSIQVASKTAIAQIVKAGGTFTRVEQTKRPVTSTKNPKNA